MTETLPRSIERRKLMINKYFQTCSKGLMGTFKFNEGCTKCLLYVSMGNFTS